MKYFLIILLFFCFSLTGCGNNSTDNPKQNNDYTAYRTTTTNNEVNTNITNTNSNIQTNNTIINNITSTDNTETEIASFSTKIYTPNDEARQTNIKITCSKLDGTVIKSRRNIFFL